MRSQCRNGALALAVAWLLVAAAGAGAEEAKYPDLRGQWLRVGGVQCRRGLFRARGGYLMPMGKDQPPPDLRNFAPPVQ